MIKPKKCPHCSRKLPFNHDLFDEELNLLCIFCDKIVVPVTDKAQDEFNKALNRWTGGRGYNYQGGYGFNHQTTKQYDDYM